MVYDPAGQLVGRIRSTLRQAQVNWANFSGGAANVTRNYSAKGLNQYVATVSNGSQSASFSYDANGNPRIRGDMPDQRRRDQLQLRRQKPPSHRFGAKAAALFLTQLPQRRHDGAMAGTETIILMIADARRRASCFSALADRPQRIVRGFADAGDAAAALDSCDAGCLVIDPAGLPAAALGGLLGAAAAHPALATIWLADGLDGTQALALVQAHPADILPAAVDAAALAARITLLLPLTQARRAQWQDRSTAQRALARLSPRECDVLAALAAGRTTKEIAAALGVSPRTIEVHRASIMRRTGTATLADLLRLYFLVALAPAPTLARAA